MRFFRHRWSPSFTLGTITLVGCVSSIPASDARKSTDTTDSGPAGATPADSGTDPDSGPAPVDPPPAIRINELMAANRGSVTGPAEAPLDWVELVNVDTETVDLSGWALTDDWRDPHKGRLPDALSLEPGERVLLWLDPDETIEGTVSLGLAREGEVLRLFDDRGEEADVLAYSDLGLDEAWARVPDGTGDAEAMPMGTPGEPNARIVEQRVRWVTEGADWRYLDGGQVPTGGMDGPWTGLDFDDSAWATGAAPLGYGDAQITVIDAGETEDGKALTAFFRHPFSVDTAEGAVTGATIGVRADDGARVWLDGEELYRLGLPAGDITADTPASRTASGDTETTYAEARIDAALLTAGAHVLSVDLHQANRTSSDMTIDLWLEVQVLVAEDAE